jgi:CRISPR system Cascade subunit CasE
MKAFPNDGADNAREDFGVLYRLTEQEKALSLYVLSDAEPMWGNILQSGFVAKGCKDVSRLPDAFIKDRRFAFDLLTQPFKKESRKGANSKRVMLKTPQERQAWLERKAKDNGFCIEWIREDGKNAVSGRHDEEKGGAMFIGAVRYRGVLIVEDQDMFMRAFMRGIGPGKAYGLGMLMLARA